ncbi:MAG: UvrB/UvrC motif-containing protein [Eubacteriales bacterium]|nr:UvrB/UvrC motif-containing protein [Eubacteriales bacterium]
MEMCERCGENPAEVHFTQVVNGKTTHLHLCRSCAEQANAELFGAGQLSNVIVGLLGLAAAKPAAEKTGRTCPVCGFELDRFAREGMLGCPACYQHFADAVQPVLKQVQGGTRHTGRRPAASTPAPVEAGDEALEELRRRLRAAIETEEYERAAVLRDEIKALEEQGEDCHE